MTVGLSKTDVPLWTYCKIRYISKFTAVLRGSPCDSTAFLYDKYCSQSLKFAQIKSISSFRESYGTVCQQWKEDTLQRMYLLNDSLLSMMLKAALILMTPVIRISVSVKQQTP